MTEKRVKLKSSDDEMFEVEEAVAFESQTVKNMIEDTGVDHPIPLPNVSSKILAKVIEYCKYHVDNQKSTDDKPATPEDEVKAWDQDFVKVDQATLFDLILVMTPTIMLFQSVLMWRFLCNLMGSKLSEYKESAGSYLSNSC
ncbi:hypothetical protein BDL97_02G060200 [Sphagnum fallax]|nr:hypothetical protein BDL97_02G060200 [Sphagnum fallax]